MLKPACRFKTRTRRRIMVVVYAIPAIPIGLVCGAIAGAAEWLPDIFSSMGKVWRQ